MADDNENHPDWRMLPAGGYPGEEPPAPAIYIPEYNGPEFLDDVDYMEVSLDEYGAAEDDLDGGEHNLNLESEEVEALLSEGPLNEQGASATVSGLQPSSEVQRQSQDNVPLPVVGHVTETQGQEPPPQLPPQPNPPQSGAVAVNTPPVGAPIGDQHVGAQPPAQNRQTTRGRSRGANTRGDASLHRTRGRAIARPLFNAPFPRAVRGTPLVENAPVPYRGRGTTRGRSSSGRIRVPRGLFRSCRYCYGTGREDPRAFATFIHRIYTSRGGSFGNNSSIASRGRRGRGRRY